MTPWLVAAPAREPLHLDEVKEWLAVTDTVEDALISGLIPPVREWAESATGRALITQTWDVKYDAFPCWFDLPKPPCQSVTSISYIDSSGVTQTLSSALYTTDLPAGPFARQGRIVPVYGSTWPSTRDVPNAVTVRIVAGYGANPADVPVMLRNAMKARLRALFEPAGRRGERIGDLDWADAQLWPFKVW